MAKKIKLNGPVISGGASWVYDWLGMETISPKRVIDELAKAAGDDVELYINSGGGSVFAGSEIYTALKEYKGKITSKVTGVAASAATFFVLASDEVFVSPLAQMMIHNATKGTEGDKVSHASGFELLEGVDRSIAKVYQARTKLPEDQVLDLMQKTTWMTAEKSVQLGFANGVMFDEEADAKNSLDLGFELPQEVIDKLKNELLKNVLNNNPIDNAQANIDPVNQAIMKNEGNDEPMDLDKLKAEHPDLYNQVLNAGVTQERTRITNLQKLADAPGAAAFIKDAIANGDTASEVAMKIVEASAKRVTQEADNRQKDAVESGAADVETEQPVGQKEKDADEEDKSVENTINFAKELINKMGGRG